MKPSTWQWVLTFVMLYLFAAFSWWALLLLRYNNELFEMEKRLLIEQLRADNPETLPQLEQTAAYQALVRKARKKRNMIFGEGIFFSLSLSVGIWFINRARLKENHLVRLQRNFLLSITHELKSPLTAIRMALQTFQGKPVPEHILRRMSAASLQETDRLGRLIDNLLLSTKMEDGYLPYKEEVCLIDLIRRCIRSLENRFPHRQIVLRTTHDSWRTSTDSMGLESVVYNLIENALKYSPDHEPVEVIVKIQSDKLFIEVHDRGIGIAPEHRASIFKKFYRVKDEQTRETNGTGLGLYIVGQLIQVLGGHIQVTDNMPKGTVFTIQLPTRVGA